MSGEVGFRDVLEANAAYAGGFGYGALDARPTRRLGILTCMDTRIDPLSVFGLSVGEAAILRNGGGRVTEDILATLVVAQHLLGVERLLVVAHTNCRMTASGPEEIHALVREAGGPDVSHIPYPATPDPAETVRADVERLRSSPLHEGLEVGGFVYDVETGLLTQVC